MATTKKKKLAKKPVKSKSKKKAKRKARTTVVVNGSTIDLGPTEAALVIRADESVELFMPVDDPDANVGGPAFLAFKLALTMHDKDCQAVVDARFDELTKQITDSEPEHEIDDGHSTDSTPNG